MKNNLLKISIIAIILITIIFTYSCKKESTTPIIPPAGPTVTDIDGNVYHTVTIGTQTWMVENLRTTKLNNGDNISYAYMGSANYPTFLNYDGNPYYGVIYGRLYNWLAVNTGKLCPIGWHVPSEAEWDTLSNYLGGDSIAGGKLKQTGSSLWNSPNASATNETGFFAIPGGMHNYEGYYTGIGNGCYLWSSTVAFFGQKAWYRYITIDDGYCSSYYIEKSSSLSVRCIKD